MQQHIDAIYENGMFKPLVPFVLSEHQRVRLSVTTIAPDDAEIVSAQRQAMEQLDAELESITDRSPDDGLTAADHDKILYGKPA
jgi:predicted DNA-binding antitoxin AbrB/MazE fold protein